MKQPFKIISFYTEGYYEKVAEEHLLPTLETFKLDNHVEKVKNFGNWHFNTDYKSSYILKMMDKFPNTNLVWVDVDATIERYPELLHNIPEEYEIGLHWLDWEKQYKRTSDKGRKELLSGTIFIRPTKKSYKAIGVWSRRIDGKQLEQDIMKRVMLDITKPKIYSLPAEYCCVITRTNAIPLYVPEPIILHHQASRIYRNNFNGK